MHDLAVEDQDQGKSFIPGFELQILWGYGSGLGFEQHAEIATGFQNRELHILQVEHGIEAQLFQELVQVVAGFAHLRFLDYSVGDNHAVAPIQNRPEPQKLQTEHAEAHLHKQQGYNGDDAVDQGYIPVLHGNDRQLRDHDGNNQFKRFQLCDLPFAHEAHGDHHEGIEEQSAG